MFIIRTLLSFLSLFVVAMNGKFVQQRDGNECLVDDIKEYIAENSRMNVLKNKRNEIEAVRNTQLPVHEKQIDNLPIEVMLFLGVGGGYSHASDKKTCLQPAINYLGFEYRWLVTNYRVTQHLKFVPQFGVSVKFTHLADRRGPHNNKFFDNPFGSYQSWSGGKMYDLIFFCEPLTGYNKIFSIYPRIGLGVTGYHLLKDDTSTNYNTFIDLAILTGFVMRIKLKSIWNIIISIDYKTNPMLYNYFTKTNDQIGLLSVFFECLTLNIGIDCKMNSSIERNAVKRLLGGGSKYTPGVFTVIIDGGIQKLRWNDQRDKYRGLGTMWFNYVFRNGVILGVSGILDFADRFEKSNSSSGLVPLNNNTVNFGFFGGYACRSKLINWFNVVGFKMFGITENSLLSMNTVKKFPCNRFFYTSRLDLKILSICGVVNEHSRLNGVLLTIGMMWDLLSTNLILAQAGMNDEMNIVRFKTFTVGVGYEF